MEHSYISLTDEEIDELRDADLAIKDAREYRFNQINLNQVQTVEHFNYRIPTNPQTYMDKGESL